MAPSGHFPSYAEWKSKQKSTPSRMHQCELGISALSQKAGNPDTSGKNATRAIQ